MSVRTSADWQLRGLQALVLENRLLRVVILPELGGKIWQLTDLRTGRDALWNNPRIPPRAVPFGSVYDDVFFGGWDELFPNDVPETIAGEPYPDHGELWAGAWDWSLDRSAPDEAGATLVCRTPISDCTVEKQIVLRSDTASVSVGLRLTNHASREQPYLWKQHVAVSLDAPATIGLPPSAVYVEDFGSPRARPREAHYTWPRLVDAAGAVHDMSRTLPASSGVAEFQYATELDQGWCSVTRADGSGIRLDFDPAVFPTCWTFASYGGWRGHEVVILEPCSGYPVSVDDGLAAGTHRTLQPGETVRTTVVATVEAAR